MLEPENRLLLLDVLRPPPGFELDQAVGTTFSLDLMSLLAAPLGFALCDREASDGRLIADPLGLIEAVRRYADRIDVFCQAGEIARPKEHQPLFTYLEDCIHEAVPPLNRRAIFHPKIWAIRYRSQDSERRTYRMLCLSRNLTFDRSWDTVLSLEGDQVAGAADQHVGDFIETLPELVHNISSERANQVRKLGDELRGVAFKPPEGFDHLAFWPLGLQPNVWPFEGSVGRLLVVSPFLSEDCLDRLPASGANHVLVSRTESLDLIGSTALSRFAETLVMSPIAEQEHEDDGPRDASPTVSDEALAERSVAELRGLHAKLYVAEGASRSRIWTGSANATGAAYRSNVEFLVELEGPKRLCGIDAFLGADGKLSLRSLLEPYRPATLEPRELTAEEQLERRLDEICRAVAQLDFVLKIEPSNSNAFRLLLCIAQADDFGADWWERILDGATFKCRPLSLQDGFLRSPSPDGDRVLADFGIRSFEAMTPFIVVEMGLAETGVVATATFVVKAQLAGAPEDRLERTLVSLLKNGRDLVRFLLLLLGEVGADDLSSAIDILTGEALPQGNGWQPSQWNTLLEPMVRSLARDPARLDDIHRVIAELIKTPDGRSLLPHGWRTVWDPIWAARQDLSRK